jgi:hypothetical protein
MKSWRSVCVCGAVERSASPGDMVVTMIDRQKVETILYRRFTGAKWDQIAAAANAIMGLDDEWQEVECRGQDLSSLSGELEHSAEIRLFRRVVKEDT